MFDDLLLGLRREDFLEELFDFEQDGQGGIAFGRKAFQHLLPRLYVPTDHQPSRQVDIERKLAGIMIEDKLENGIENVWR